MIFARSLLHNFRTASATEVNAFQASQLHSKICSKRFPKYRSLNACQTYSVGFSSGDAGGNGSSDIFFGTCNLLVVC
jgi:hypothetical protein